ncbi:MAG: hypothetical protein IPK53_09365 [bacterium]|nr:hypothetical protein [bacterium]
MTPAWRVAAALALACNLDWGRWVAGRDGWCGRRTCPPDLDGQCRCASPPVADPSDVDAYLADCARRGVEPGPLPAREYATGEVAWVVAPERDGTVDYVAVRAGAAQCTCEPYRGRDGTVDYVAVRAGGGIEVSTQEDHPQWSVCPNSRCTAADLALLSTLVTAAAAALETTDG